MRVVEAIQKFLTLRSRPDLAALYSPDMECQITVGQDGGTRVDGEFKGHSYQAWTDGGQTWKPIRIPYKASSEPEYDLNKVIQFDLDAHAEGVGMTGWDWTHRLSRWVGFDFDAIIGHSDSHTKTLNNDELIRIQNTVQDIPWITLRKSTSGKGLHIYVHLSVSTQNHTEHQALARAILGKMSALTGYDFCAKVDAFGGNMWVWHRKMVGTDGLTLIKKGTPLEDVPPNWLDHLQVIHTRKGKARPTFLEEQSADVSLFEELTSERPKTPLDEEHRTLLRYLLEDQRTGSWWDSDRWMLVTHTYQLKRAHTDLSLRGIFYTLATDDEGGTDKNCFCFPNKKGAWAVRRYTPGVEEHPSWSQDQSGYTRCHLNMEPDLKTAARAFGASESVKGQFHFSEMEVAVKAAQAIGALISIPAPWASTRTAVLYSRPKDGKLVVEFERKDSDQLPGWLAQKNQWIKIFDTKTEKVTGDTEIGTYDDLIRHLVTEGNEDSGWAIKTDKGWQTESRENVKSFGKAQGLSGKEVDILMGQSVAKAWQLVNRPFAEEYPGGRCWNRDSAQFRYLPSHTDNPKYPHWLKILKHCGEGLDNPVSQDGWCQANAILTGADYLKTWIASMFQRPLEPLPYLFFYSPEQDTGKSILHEAIELLITSGLARADAALTNDQGFNGELIGAVLCVVEETDLNFRKVRNSPAYSRIKDWVTARQLPIHPKKQTPYHIPNSTHWLQCSNDINACPIFPGDTRITMIRVKPLDPLEMIPKTEMFTRLTAEAPDFLNGVLNVDLPQPCGRLSLPIITTEEKIETQNLNRSPVQMFIEDHCYRIPGVMCLYSELWQKFQEITDPSEIIRWTQQKFDREMAMYFPRGRDPASGKHHFGNISLWPPQNGHPEKPELVSVKQGQYLILIPSSHADDTGNT